MMYKPSNQLVDILLKHGFTDLTEKLYPDHYKRMQQRGYDPYSIKRVFSHSAHNDSLLFHYTTIRLHHTGKFNHTEERYALTTDELKSLLVFYKLPAQLGREWLEAYKNALELHRYYHKICLLPQVFNTDTDYRIKETFESLYYIKDSTAATANTSTGFQAALSGS
jgi:hypothetical protein